LRFFKGGKAQFVTVGIIASNLARNEYTVAGYGLYLKSDKSAFEDRRIKIADFDQRFVHAASMSDC
jgi:hypothetical protein